MKKSLDKTLDSASLDKPRNFVQKYALRICKAGKHKKSDQLKYKGARND